MKRKRIFVVPNKNTKMSEEDKEKLELLNHKLEKTKLAQLEEKLKETFLMLKHDERFVFYNSLSDHNNPEQIYKESIESRK